MARSALRVAVLDDHEIFRRGLRTCLLEEPGIELSDDGPCDPQAIDVAVTCLELLATVPSGVPAVVCCDEPPSDVALNGHHAFAVLPRRSLRAEQLIAAVRAAAAGLRVVANAEAPSTLDARSVAVLKLLALGKGTREISELLGYSERTIKSVIAGGQLALGTRTRAQSVAEAVRRAII
ncbi:MAG TPA: LuxR C-terminal-related transcriptional regulator [Acidimicrobiales bacterium]|nr:LuxR C-terminal-related transcriptional regulator [Acidimicrobiales bacterium]